MPNALFVSFPYFPIDDLCPKMWHLENFLPLKLAQFVKKYYLCSRKRKR